MNKIKSFENNPSINVAKQEFDSLLKRKETVVLLKSNLILLGLSWIFFGIFFQLLPPKIPIFFSRPWGVSQLADKNYFILYPSVITLLFFINVRIASVSIKKDVLMATIVLWAQLICSLLATIAVIKIIFLLA
jgi:lysylphosphatidylglycerol synthetase-like protein (DUF2156 family)